MHEVAEDHSRHIELQTAHDLPIGLDLGPPTLHVGLGGGITGQTADFHTEFQSGFV